MKYIKQFGIIVLLAFLGELLHEVLPFPIPARIYGILLLFLCLEWKVIPVSAIRETSRFLIDVMPIMFIPAAAGLMDSWQIIKASWVSYGIITVVSTFAVMIISGKTVQAVIKLVKRKEPVGK